MLIEKYAHLERLEDLLPVAMQTLKYKMLGENRRRWRRKEDQQVPLDELALAFQGPDPEAWAIRREFRRMLPVAVRALSRPCRELIKLRIEGKSLKEIIEQLGEPSGTVYARSSRCWDALEKKLREMLEGRQEES